VEGTGIRRLKPVSVALVLSLVTSFSFITVHWTHTARGTIVGGHISVDTTWDLAGSPYQVMENVIVDLGATLTIDPGVSVQFDSWQPPPLLHLFVEGRLNATGNETSMIQFSALNPAPTKWWGALQMNDTGIADIRYCNISSADSAIIMKSLSGVNVTNNIITDAIGSVELFRTETPGHFFANNTVVNSWMVLDSPNNTVIGNEFRDAGGLVIRSDHNLVQDNIFNVSSFRLDGADHNIVLNNTNYGNPEGLHLISGSDYNTISRNVFLNNPSSGIYHNVGSGNIISDNYVSGGGTCLDLANGRSMIRNNTFADCTYGIDIWGDNYQIMGNRIDNNDFGIVVVTSSGHRIVMNEISRSSQYGIYVIGSQDLHVYHNDFVDNAVQARDDNSSGRFWDGGYPLGGNYWSD
jgi:parallel beta-helix repeat protein